MKSNDKYVSASVPPLPPGRPGSITGMAGVGMAGVGAPKVTPVKDSTLQNGIEVSTIDENNKEKNRKYTVFKILAYHLNYFVFFYFTDSSKVFLNLLNFWYLFNELHGLSNVFKGWSQ